MDTIPNDLTNSISNGSAVLFLGAGATIGAKLPNSEIPIGNDLRDLLCKKFLDEDYLQQDLSYVAELAISQYSLFEIQDFIRDYLSDIAPADFHLKIPNFNWRAIFTTNYDRLIETSYEKNNGQKKLEIILSNDDRFDITRKDGSVVPILKLHGCITRTRDRKIPLILTIDQFNESLGEHRKRLFSHLYELAYENNIIFIGHKLRDVNIRKIMNDVMKESPSGMRHYLIQPGIKDADRNLWHNKKVTPINNTFEGLIKHLDSSITQNQKVLSSLTITRKKPIQRRFATHNTPSRRLVEFLENEAEFLHGGTKYKSLEAKHFYRGINQDWYPVAEDLAIKRRLTKSIEEEILQTPDSGRKKLEFYVIKGEAGSGKSIFLRDIAWASKSLGIGIFLWVHDGKNIDLGSIEEIYNNAKERIFLIWDNTALNLKEIIHFYKDAKNKSIPITIITAERPSEWNNRCEQLQELTDNEFKLGNLDSNEINQLINSLEKHQCLGPNLISKSHDERVKEFEIASGRQLLVALYEVTSGKSFEDIIFDEYEKIRPISAQKIYLTVCTLNRLRVPVRAGLISRIHHITFDKFQKDFFKPLERIVITDIYGGNDMQYKARHPEIAEIVFKKALEHQSDRYHEYMNIISKINISFESDKSSFRLLTKAKSLMSAFNSHEDIESIYEECIKHIGKDPYILQQIANFERLRPNGNLKKASGFLKEAKEISPYDSSIVHSLAVLAQDEAKKSSDRIIKNKYRAEARDYLKLISTRWGDSTYVRGSLADLALDELSDALENNESNPIVIDDLARKIEKEIIEAKRKYFDDPYLLSTEAKFASLINDNDRAISALEKSFNNNNRDPYIASRLSSTYKKRDFLEKAKETLVKAIERNTMNQHLNFQYAELIRELEQEENHDKLIYHYKKSYTPGDGNYQAQFWHARFLFESDNEESQNERILLFNRLRESPTSYGLRKKIRDTSKRKFEGRLVTKKDNFGFISIDGRGDEIYVSGDSILDNLWGALDEGDRLSCYIGFSYNGPVCKNVEPL